MQAEITLSEKILLTWVIVIYSYLTTVIELSEEILWPELFDLLGGNNSIREDSTDLGYCQFRMPAKYVIMLVFVQFDLYNHLSY